jgi:hypothetical protein
MPDLDSCFILPLWRVKFVAAALSYRFLTEIVLASRFTPTPGGMQEQFRSKKL